MFDVMFATPQMENEFFASLPYHREMGGLFFVDWQPVFGGRRLFQRALHRRLSPYFIRSYIVTQNASKKPENSYHPENWEMLVNIGQMTARSLAPLVIAWHSHPVGGSWRPSNPDWNNWWQLWKVTKVSARGAIVHPHHRYISLFEFGVVENGNSLNVANERHGSSISWHRSDLAEVRKMYKANKVN